MKADVLLQQQKVSAADPKVCLAFSYAVVVIVVVILELKQTNRKFITHLGASFEPRTLRNSGEEYEI